MLTVLEAAEAAAARVSEVVLLAPLTDTGKGWDWPRKTPPVKVIIGAVAMANCPVGKLVKVVVATPPAKAVVELTNGPVCGEKR